VIYDVVSGQIVEIGARSASVYSRLVLNYSTRPDVSANEAAHVNYYRGLMEVEILYCPFGDSGMSQPAWLPFFAFWHRNVKHHVATSHDPGLPRDEIDHQRHAFDPIEEQLRELWDGRVGFL
jgi:hypothetical protein